MDAFLALIVVLLLFAVFIFIIHRSAKIIFVLGTIMLVIIALRAVGVLG